MKYLIFILHILCSKLEICSKSYNFQEVFVCSSFLQPILKICQLPLTLDFLTALLILNNNENIINI